MSSVADTVERVFIPEKGIFSIGAENIGSRMRSKASEAAAAQAEQDAKQRASEIVSAEAEQAAAGKKSKQVFASLTNRGAAGFSSTTNNNSLKTFITRI